MRTKRDRETFCPPGTTASRWVASSASPRAPPRRIAAHSSTTAVVAAAAARESPWVPLAPNVGDQGPASADRGGQQAGPADRPVPHGGIDKETGGQPTGGEGDADEEKPALKRSSSRRATRRLEGGRHRGGGGAGGEGEFPFRLVAVLRHDVPVDQVDLAPFEANGSLNWSATTSGGLANRAPWAGSVPTRNACASARPAHADSTMITRQAATPRRATASRVAAPWRRGPRARRVRRWGSYDSV